MTLNISNLLFAEPLLVEAVRAGVPAFKSVAAWDELPDTISDLGPTPAAYIVFEGTENAGSAGPAALSRQFWTVAVAVRQGQTKAGKAEQLELAGELLAQVQGVCQGLKLPKSQALTLHNGPGVRYYKGGQAVFFMTYALHCPLLPS